MSDYILTQQEIKCRPFAGADVNDCIEEAIKISASKKIDVSFKINGNIVTIKYANLLKAGWSHVEHESDYKKLKLAVYV